MAFKNFEELEAGAAAAGQSWSDADKALARKNMDFGNSIYTLKNDWSNAMKRGDTASAQHIHDQTEDFRKRYGGYSGGADGSEYIKDGTYFNYDDPYDDVLGGIVDSIMSYEAFENPYRQQLAQVVEQYTGRGPFSYDLDSDPVWGQYQKTYLREGQRAREDTLGNYAASTGGQASTAAAFAASQAQDYYNAQMADKIPQLYENAYDRWLNEGEQYASQLNALRGLSADALNEWNANRSMLKDQLSGVQGLSDSLYDRSYQKWKSDYQVGRDALSDSRYADELSYSRGEDAYSREWKQQQAAMEQALEWLKLGIEPDSAVTGAAGISDQDVQSYLGAVQAQMAAKNTGRSSGRSTSRSSGGSSGSTKGTGSASGSTAQDYAGLFRDAYRSGHPENFIATNYKNYGFTKSTGLSKEYRSLYDEEFTDALDATKDMVNRSEYSPSMTRAHLKAKGYSDQMIERIMEAI